MSGYLSVRNWGKYQHYRDRRPIWIKFYVEMLHDDELQGLPIPARLLFDQLLLLAGEYANAIPNDSELIAKLVRMPPRTVRESLAELLRGRWIKATQTKRRASKPASKVASPEKEVEKEKETPYIPLPTDPVENLRLVANLAGRIR